MVEGYKTALADVAIGAQDTYYMTNMWCVCAYREALSIMTIWHYSVLRKATQTAYSNRLYHGGPSPNVEERESRPDKHHIESVASGLARMCGHRCSSRFLRTSLS